MATVKIEIAPTYKNMYAGFPPCILKATLKNVWIKETSMGYEFVFGENPWGKYSVLLNRPKLYSFSIGKKQFWGRMIPPSKEGEHFLLKVEKIITKKTPPKIEVAVRYKNKMIWVEGEMRYDPPIIRFRVEERYAKILKRFPSKGLYAFSNDETSVMLPMKASAPYSGVNINMELDKEAEYYDYVAWDKLMLMLIE